jgi:mono/diheme cytochrome c family protein
MRASLQDATFAAGRKDCLRTTSAAALSGIFHNYGMTSAMKIAALRKRSRRERWTNTIVCTAVCGFCAWYVATLSVATQSPSQPPGATTPASSRTIWSNVYSASQAKRGEAGANRLCTKCHGADLTGGQDGPSLVGAEVLGSWASLTLGDLLDRIKTTMPADAPRSLGQQETVDILAYMLSLNKCPAGDEELPPGMEVLSQIRVTGQPERK